MMGMVSLILEREYEETFQFCKALHELTRGKVRALGSPLGAFPAGNIYVKLPEELLPVPPVMVRLAKDVRLWAGSSAHRALPVLDDIHRYFKDVAMRAFPDTDKVGIRWYYDAREFERKTSPERLLTAKYHIDTAELDGARLGAFLGLSLGLYDEILRRISTARELFATTHEGQAGKLNVCATHPALYVHLDGFMLTAFASCLLGGGVEPV
jgi:hypothetical protein